MNSYRIPVVAVVGRGDSGRTTLLEGIISVLTARGWRVATAKNHAHATDIDVPGKDTWRHERAGAVVTMVSAPNRIGVIRRVEQALSLSELADLAGDVDILLTEGFRGSAPVRIEVVRTQRSSEPTCDPEELFALVTDNEALDFGPGVPKFGLDDAQSVAELIETTFLGGEQARPMRQGDR